MPDLQNLGLVDFVVLALAVLTAVVALRRRRGLLGTAGSVLGTLVLAWAATVAITAWGPAPAVDAVHDSTFAQTLPAPTRAIDDLHHLTDN